MYALAHRGSVRADLAIVVHRRVQGLTEVFGIVGNKAGVDQTLVADRLILGPAAVFGKGRRQPSRPFDDGIGCKAHPLRIEPELLAQFNKIIASDWKGSPLQVLEIEEVLTVLSIVQRRHPPILKHVGIDRQMRRDLPARAKKRRHLQRQSQHRRLGHHRMSIAPPGADRCGRTQQNRRNQNLLANSHLPTHPFFLQITRPQRIR